MSLFGEYLNEYKYEEIGTIDLSFDEALNEESITGLDLDRRGQCIIYVYGGERDTIHFHIVPKDKSYKNSTNPALAECCIGIYEPFYFNHSGKIGILNSKEKKILDTELRKRRGSDLGSTTYWDNICDAFSRLNPDVIARRKNPLPTEQPDYTKLA